MAATPEPAKRRAATPVLVGQTWIARDQVYDRRIVSVQQIDRAMRSVELVVVNAAELRAAGRRPNSPVRMMISSLRSAFRLQEPTT